MYSACTHTQDPTHHSAFTNHIALERALLCSSLLFCNARRPVTPVCFVQRRAARWMAVEWVQCGWACSRPAETAHTMRRMGRHLCANSGFHIRTAESEPRHFTAPTCSLRAPSNTRLTSCPLVNLHSSLLFQFVSLLSGGHKITPNALTCEEKNPQSVGRLSNAGGVVELQIIFQLANDLAVEHRGWARPGVRDMHDFKAQFQCKLRQMRWARGGRGGGNTCANLAQRPAGGAPRPLANCEVVAIWNRRNNKPLKRLVGRRSRGRRGPKLPLLCLLSRVSSKRTLRLQSDRGQWRQFVVWAIELMGENEARNERNTQWCHTCRQLGAETDREAVRHEGTVCFERLPYNSRNPNATLNHSIYCNYYSYIRLLILHTIDHVVVLLIAIVRIIHLWWVGGRGAVIIKAASN